MTDALRSYEHPGEEGFIHMSINHALAYAKGRIHTNSLENFWNLVARMINGTYVAIEPFHLDAYVDEQCWRFNNRKLTDEERMQRGSGSSWQANYLLTTDREECGGTKM